MEKAWLLQAGCSPGKYKTLVDAETAAKKFVARNNENYGIYELVAYASAPIPDVEIVKV